MLLDWFFLSFDISKEMEVPKKVKKMPYIKQEDRVRLHNEFNINWDEIHVNSPGDLNYLVTCLISKYLTQHGLRYQQINDVVGALEGAKLEFYRKVAVPYEDKKIAENGEVLPENFRT
jgi:hypothetical protein